jgi:magnesium transporter
MSDPVREMNPPVDSTPERPPHILRGRPQQEIERLVRERDFFGLRQLCERWEPFELANLLSELPSELKAVAFRVLPKSLAAHAFEYLSFEDQEDLLKALGQSEVAGILDEMAPDDRTALLEELPSAVQTQLLGLLNEEERRVAQTLLGYPEGSVGRLMTPDYLALRSEWTVRQALEFIRDNGEDKETLNVVYVTEADGKLIDGLRIRRLLLAPPNQRLFDIISSTLVSLFAGDSAEDAVEVFRQTGLYALPVTSSSGKMLGIVTLDDVLNVAEERATSDMQKVGASGELEEPYLELTVWQMLLKRAPWLIVLFLGGLLTANAMAFFEGEIEKAAVLVIFLPLIIASGGNSGSQAATLIIRAMAVGDVRLRDWLKVLSREIANGLAIGLSIGAIGFLIVLIGAQFSGIFTEFWPKVALTVSASLTGVILWGSLVGSMLPLVLRKIGLDPATSSAPFVATLVDVTGIVIYFSVATIILKGTIL